MMTWAEYGRCFEALGIGEKPLAGDKNTSPGEPYRTLSANGIRIPNGCAISAGLEGHGARQPRVQALSRQPRRTHRHSRKQSHRRRRGPIT